MSDAIPSDPPPGEAPAGAAPPIQAGLFELRDGDLVLRGGWSATSGYRHFPRKPVCPFTGADDVVDVDLPRVGRLRWWTAVNAAPPGYEGPVPYGLGVVALDGDDDLRVVTRLTVADPTRLADDDAMVLVAEELATADGPRTTWAFAPAGATS